MRRLWDGTDSQAVLMRSFTKFSEVFEGRLTRLTRDDSGISLIFGGTATKMLQISHRYPGTTDSQLTVSGI